MSWEDTRDTFRNQNLYDVVSDYKVANIRPIVLRFKKPIRSHFIISQGFHQVTIDRVENTKGDVEMVSRVEKNKPTVFFKDKFNIGYAVMPAFPHNLKTLAAVSLDKECPWVLVTPDDVIKDIKDIADGLAPKSEIQKVSTVKKAAVIDKKSKSDAEDLIASVANAIG